MTISGNSLVEGEVFVAEEGRVVNGSGVETCVVDVKISELVEGEGVVVEEMLMVKTLKSISLITHWTST